MPDPVDASDPGRRTCFVGRVSVRLRHGVHCRLRGVRVADLEAAIAWYERFAGRPADLVPNDDEAAWRFTESGWIYLVRDAAARRRGGGDAARRRSRRALAALAGARPRARRGRDVRERRAQGDVHRPRGQHHRLARCRPGVTRAVHEWGLTPFAHPALRAAAVAPCPGGGGAPRGGGARPRAPRAPLRSARPARARSRAAPRRSSRPAPSPWPCARRRPCRRPCPGTTVPSVAFSMPIASRRRNSFSWPFQTLRSGAAMKIDE